MQNVRPSVTGLEVQTRVAHNDQTPMQSIVYRNKEEVLAEDVHALHNELCTLTYAH